MPAFSSHHCPKCGRVGNKHCIAAGHYVDCDIHPGSFHSALVECVKCAHSKQRQEKEERTAAQKMKEEEEEDDSKNQKKKAKAPKPKPDSQKSMKQLRKEKKEKRRSEGSQDSSPCHTEESKNKLASVQKHMVTHFLDDPDTWRHVEQRDLWMSMVTRAK